MTGEDIANKESGSERRELREEMAVSEALAKSSGSSEMAAGREEKTECKRRIRHCISK